VTPDTVLFQAVVYLGAAVLLVPIASRLGLGSVLGYLIAGVAIGPFALGLVSDESHTVMQFAEFGVVMMLFLVGLELDPGRLWRLRGPVLGLGGLQVGGTALAVTPIAMALGLPWQAALALGLCVAMSSTAIALQTLTEKGLLKTSAGQVSFSVLLFQDLSVIPILALFPLLATFEVVHGGEGGHGGGSLVDALPAWGQGLVVLGAVALVVIAGRLGVGPLMRVVARTGLREMFTATALLLVLAVALLMTSVGLSAALGTFVAGVVLANSEYRHELVSDVEPFKGLLLGTFFIAVGASIDFGLLAESPARIAALVLLVVAVKVAVLFGVGRYGGLGTSDRLLFAVALSQVGEFAFVLLSLAASEGVLPTSVTAPMTAVTAFSMALTPLLLTGLERVVLPRLASRAGAGRESDVVDEQNPVIIAGYGRFGQIGGRLLRANGIGVTVLDVDSEQIDAMRKFGMKVFYGDAARLDLLQAAGAEHAKVLVVAVDDPERCLDIVRLAKRHFPNLAILARARGRTEAYDLLDEDVQGIYRETFETAVRVGQDVLRLLGVPAYAAHRMARTFRHHDERVMHDLASARKDNDQFVSKVRERIADFEQLMRTEVEGPALPPDPGWDSEEMRQDILAANQTPR
jgi:monovalent cation:proton antiporter-2 (CPA2) family protein